MNKLTSPAMMRGCLLACLLCSGTAAQAQSDEVASEATATDKALVENLQKTREAMKAQMPGLSAEQITVLQELYDEKQSARENPRPPTVSNKVTFLKRGESPGLTIMERFDTTLVFADRQGNPMEITAHKISDDSAAALVPLHTQEGGAVIQDNARPASEGQIAPAEAVETAEELGPIKGLIVTPKSTMRSTNITVMLKGQTFPIVLSLSTRSTRNQDEALAYIQEMRLGWASIMPEAQALAGKFTGSNNGDGALSRRMMSLVQGVPDSALEPVELKGDAASQVSLWYDRENEEWYLRLGEHIEPWNISIADRTNDGLRGFSVIRLNGEPPKLIGLSVNGQYTTVQQES